jgi:hypothetical protein
MEWQEWLEQAVLVRFTARKSTVVKMLIQLCAVNRQPIRTDRPADLTCFLQKLPSSSRAGSRMVLDPRSFTAFERSAHDRIAETYAEHFAPLTSLALSPAA